MKNKLRIALNLILLALLGFASLGASECTQNPGCTQCGFNPGEHIVTSYLDGDGIEIPVSGYADQSGCFTPYGCP